MNRSLRPAALTAVCLLAMSTGCTSTGNDRTFIGDERHGATVKLSALHGAEALTPATGPSLTTVDRRDWEQKTFHVPVDGTFHGPHLTSLYPAFNGTLARRNGLHPTADSATLDEPRTAPASEFAASTLAAATNVVMLVPRALAPSLRPEDVSYQRYQVGGLPTSGYAQGADTGHGG